MARMERIRQRIGRKDSEARLDEAGIRVYRGAAQFLGPDTLEVGGVCLTFARALIATGSRPRIPSIPGLTEAGFLTSESVFDLTTRPESLLVIGGGPLGCELAQTFARFGTRCLIVHSAPLFLPLEERDAAQMVSDALARDGVEIHLNTTVAKVQLEDGQKRVELLSEGRTATALVGSILTGVGRRPAVEGLDLEKAGVRYDAERGVYVDDFLRTSNRRIYAAGDVCLDQQYTNSARASARVAVRNALCFGRARMSALTIPWCTYTDPEIAHVGLYVREARQRQIPVKTYTIPMHEVDRAIADGEETGFVKIHVREGTDRILGATIVATHAGDTINSITTAMLAGIGLQHLAEVIQAYPTQAGALGLAAEAWRHAQRASPWEKLLRYWLGWSLRARR
jgi:pyruvate/2-oxoglutarate dehydrogenase complex dihydrolipoamide dehydrogenase (E3) component